ncbi:MAG: ASPIC/UnbV domain-containing protein, partial [Bacteroidota bacterium]
LDLVTNNINEPAGVFRNNVRERQAASSHYLQVDLRGSAFNRHGIGTKIWLRYGDTTLYHEHYRQRGYLSTVDQLVHFGLGQNTSVDELIVHFPDGRGTVLRDIAADQAVYVEWSRDLQTVLAPATAAPKGVWRAIALEDGPVHRASTASEFDVNVLSLRDRGQHGPDLEVIDLDEDGVDELIFGQQVWRQENGQLVRTTDTIAANLTRKTKVYDDFTGNGMEVMLRAADYMDLCLFVPGEKTRRLPNTAGWWYSLNVTDLDQDGDLDVVAGNVGLNIPYRVSSEQPLVVREDDFDGNGRLDVITLAYNGDRLHPVHPRNTLTRQLPSWKRMLTSFAAYGQWTADDLPPMGETGVERYATEFRSLYLENDGTGNFTAHPLPAAAQIAPLQDAINVTLDDGRPGLLCVQNDYAVEPLGGHFDAGTGFVLTLNEAGELVVREDLVRVRGDARAVVKLRTAEGGEMILVGMHDGPLLQLIKD